MKNATFPAGADAEASGVDDGTALTRRSPVEMAVGVSDPSERTNARASRPDDLGGIVANAKLAGASGNSVEESSMRKAPWAEPIDSGWDSPAPAQAESATKSPVGAAKATDAEHTKLEPPTGAGNSRPSRPVNPARFPSAMQELAHSDPDIRLSEPNVEPPRPRTSSSSDESVAGSPDARSSGEKSSAAATEGTESNAVLASQVSDSIIPSLVIDVSEAPREPAPFEMAGSIAERSAEVTREADPAPIAKLPPVVAVELPAEAPAETIRAAVASAPEVTTAASSDAPSAAASSKEILEASPVQERVADSNEIRCDKTLMSGRAFPEVSPRAGALGSERLQVADSPSVQLRAARARQESLLSLDVGYAGDFFSSPPAPSPSDASIPLDVAFDGRSSQVETESVRAARQVRRSRVRVVVWGVMAVSLALVAFSIYALWQRGSIG
jgi:hypothetical protein